VDNYGDKIGCLGISHNVVFGEKISEKFKKDRQAKGFFIFS